MQGLPPNFANVTDAGFQWPAELLTLHVISDLLIVLAYISIPVGLFLYARKQESLIRHAKLIKLLILLIILSGLSHVMAIWQLWSGDSWLSGMLKATMAGLSVLVAFTLWPLIPKILGARTSQDGNQLAETKDKAIQSQDAVHELAQLRRDLEYARNAQTRFLTNMSHEIRTPLGGILGYADQLLCDHTLRRAQRDVVTHIRRCADHLRTLISDVLDFSKIEAGMLELTMERVNISHLLNQVASIMESRMQDKQLNFRICYRTPIPNIIFTDSLRLRQILINLLSNATKFTENNGRVALEVAAEMATDNGNSSSQERKLIFTVSDTGCGIDDVQQERLFQRFSRLDDSLTRRTEGTGLGLAISKRLSHHLNGDLQLIESVPGQGSVFQLNITCTIKKATKFLHAFEADSIAPDDLVDPKEIEGSLAGVKVLLVEDGIDNQRIFNFFLHMAGAKVTLAPNGEKALELASDEHDVVFMDIQLPIMDGRTATQKLRAQGFKQPIIALTAHASRMEEERCRQIGFDDYITKPVNIRRLIYATAHHAGLVPTTNDELEAHPPPIKSPSTKTQSEPGPADCLRSEYHDQAIFRTLIIEFTESLPARLEIIDQAGKEGAWSTLEFEAHKLKGAASTYGYPALSIAAADLEDAARLLTQQKVQPIVAMDQLSRFHQLCQRVISGAHELRLQNS